MGRNLFVSPLDNKNLNRWTKKKINEFFDVEEKKKLHKQSLVSSTSLGSNSSSGSNNNLFKTIQIFFFSLLTWSNIRIKHQSNNNLINYLPSSHSVDVPFTDI